MKNLKYRIYSVSSQAQQFPASNLINCEQGWQSERMCKYPQQITIQFYIPIRTKSLKLVFHQYKIPKMIQVFIKAVKAEKYRKLGYIRPDQNQQSGYENKQIKTVFFEFPCSFIKLVIHENYKNQYNLFDQVSIQDLSVQGQVLSGSQLRNLDLSQIQTDSQNDQQYNDEKQRAKELQYNKKQQQNYNNKNNQTLFSQVFKSLEIQKKQAVEKEDFQKAAHLKNLIANFKQLENQIKHLQQQKLKAVQQQDFDKCHQLKNQINRKKQIVQFQINNLHQNQSRYYSRVVFDTTNKESKANSQILNAQQLKSPPRIINNHQNQVVPALRKKSIKQQNNIFDINNESRAQQSRLTDQKNGNFSGYNNEDFQNNQPMTQAPQKLQQLDFKLKNTLQQYFAIISQENWMRIVSKNWKSKNNAINQLINLEIKSQLHFFAVLEMISYIIQDSHPTVVLFTLNMLKKLINSRVQIILPNHLPFYIEKIIQTLIGMLNDTNVRIKQQSFSTFIDLPDLAIFPLNVVIGNILKHKQKLKSDPRILCIKIDLIIALIQKYQDSQFYYQEILPWGVNAISEANSEVRTRASNLLIILGFQMGSERIKLAIKDVRPNIQNSFIAQLNVSIESSKMYEIQSKLQKEMMKNSKIRDSELKRFPQSPIPGINLKESEQIDLAYSQQSIFDTSKQKNNRFWQQEHQNLTSSKSNQNQIRVMEINQNQCQYCFRKVIQMRQHLINDCPALVYCQICNCRIYIRQMTDHLLNQCKKQISDDSQEEVHYQQCKKCGLAFEMDQINQHVALGSCKIKKQNKDRCQFCAQDVNSNDESWLEHALTCNKLPTNLLAYSKYKK